MTRDNPLNTDFISTKGETEWSGQRRQVLTHEELRVSKEAEHFCAVWSGHRSRSAGSHQKLEEARDRFSPRASRRSKALPAP